MVTTEQDIQALIEERRQEALSLFGYLSRAEQQATPELKAFLAETTQLVLAAETPEYVEAQRVAAEEERQVAYAAIVEERLGREPVDLPAISEKFEAFGEKLAAITGQVSAAASMTSYPGTSYTSQPSTTTTPATTSIWSSIFGTNLTPWLVIAGIFGTILLLGRK